MAETYNKECCGTCRWHIYDPSEEDFVCMNEDCDYYALVTSYTDICENNYEPD